MAGRDTQDVFTKDGLVDGERATLCGDPKTGAGQSGLWGDRYCQNELSTRLFSENVQIALKLLGERVHETHTQSPARFYIECGRKTYTFITHRYCDVIVRLARQSHPDFAIPRWIGVLGRIRDKLIDQKHRRNRAISSDFNAVLYADIHLTGGHGVIEVLAHVAQIGPKV